MQSSAVDDLVDQDLGLQVALAVVRDAASARIHLGKEGLEALLKVRRHISLSTDISSVKT